MFKERYQALYDQISPEPLLVQKVKRHAAAQKTAKKRPRAYRAGLAIAAVLLVFIAAMPSLAANISPIGELMRYIAPEIAQYFTPVQKSCEDNGIRMEVVSAYIHENVAEIYITMTDLIGDRIDESMDLYDSYAIQRPFDSSATCRQVGYDEESKTATFLIEISQWDGRDIEGDKITFSIREFLSHKKEYRDVVIPLDLAQVGAGIPRTDVETSGGSWSGEKREEPAVLSATRELALPFPEITVTGAGYLDGRLHLQTRVYDRLEMDHHGFLYLQDAWGKRVDSSAVIYFNNGKTGDAREDYCEFIFDIPQSEAMKYRAFGEFTISGMKTEGNWSVTFPLETPRR